MTTAASAANLIVQSSIAIAPGCGGPWVVPCTQARRARTGNDMFEVFNKHTPKGLRVEVLSGLTVALALIPEAVAFALIAGVHPLVGLYAAFMMGLLAAVF